MNKALETCGTTTKNIIFIGVIVVLKKWRRRTILKSTQNNNDRKVPKFDNLNLHVKEAKQTLNKLSPEKSTPRHIKTSEN